MWMMLEEMALGLSLGCDVNAKMFGLYHVIVFEAEHVGLGLVCKSSVMLHLICDCLLSVVYEFSS